MASDLKIEIFACTLFYKTWILKDLDEPNILQIFGDECCKVENIDEVLDELFIFPIVCRRKMFKSIYLADFTDENAKSLTSLSECYNYVSRKCDYLFGGLTVFERVFATFAFVSDFCARIYDYNRQNVIENGHIFWAMYFDKFTEEFYLGGGWPGLKEVAKDYVDVVSLLYFFDKESVFKLKEATENYFDFKNSDHYEEHKRNGKENVSKLWIKFRKQRFENYIRIPTTNQYFSTALEFENLLASLKNILGIRLKQIIPFTDRKCSEIRTDHADNKINTNDAIGIQHLPERKCETSNTNHMQENMSNRNPTPCNFPDAMLLNSETEDARGNEKLTLEKNLETSRPKKETDLKETDNKMEMMPTSLMSEAEYIEKLSTCILPTSQFIDSYIDELYSSNAKIEETMSALDVLSTGQIRESLIDKKLSPCRVPEVTHLCSQSDSNGREVNKSLEATHSKNGENQTEDAKRKAMQFTSLMAESESDEYSHILPTRQFIDEYVDELYLRKTTIEKTSSVPECLSTIPVAEFVKDGNTTSDTLPKVSSPKNGCESTVDEIKKIDGSQEDLKNEQEERIFKNFLRMILVLNDRQGTKSVYQALQNIEEDSKKIEVIPNKTKKSKKKNK